MGANSPWTVPDDTYDPHLHGDLDRGYWLEDNKGLPKGHPDWRPWNAPEEQKAPHVNRALAVVASMAAAAILIGVFLGMQAVVEWVAG